MESPQRTSCCSGPHRGPHSETSWKFRPAHGLLPLYLTMLRILPVWLGRRSRLSWLPGKEARLSSRSVTRALVILCSFDSGEINAPGSTGVQPKLRAQRLPEVTAYGTDSTRVVDRRTQQYTKLS